MLCWIWKTLYNEKKDDEERENIRRKVMPLIQKAGERTKIKRQINVKRKKRNSEDKRKKG